MSFDDLAKEFGFSWATFYRYRRILIELDAGKTILTSSQKRYVKPKQWNKKETDLALKIMTVTKNGISFKHFHT